MSYVKTDACSQEVPCFHTLLGNSELKLTSKKKKDWTNSEMVQPVLMGAIV